MANEQNLIPFKDGYDPRRNLRGRTKKYETKLSEKGYKKAQIIDAINILLTMDEQDLREVSENQDATVLEKVVALAILESIKKKTLYNIETLLTRVYGQPKQEVETQVNLTTFQVKFNESGSGNIQP